MLCAVGRLAGVVVMVAEGALPLPEGRPLPEAEPLGLLPVAVGEAEDGAGVEVMVKTRVMVTEDSARSGPKVGLTMIVVESWRLFEFPPPDCWWW